MSRSTQSRTRVARTLAWVALLAACSTPLPVGPLCGPDDPPGTDCRRPQVPSDPRGLLVLELSQQGLPEPQAVQYHFVMVDLSSGDTAATADIQANAIRAESRHAPGRYRIEYLGLALAAGGASSSCSPMARPDWTSCSSARCRDATSDRQNLPPSTASSRARRLTATPRSNTRGRRSSPPRSPPVARPLMELREFSPCQSSPPTAPSTP
jgi:hypothetical protein